jgi:hypothetical protein
MRKYLIFTVWTDLDCFSEAKGDLTESEVLRDDFISAFE